MDGQHSQYDLYVQSLSFIKVAFDRNWIRYDLPIPANFHPRNTLFLVLHFKNLVRYLRAYFMHKHFHVGCKDCDFH